MTTVIRNPYSVIAVLLCVCSSAMSAQSAQQRTATTGYGLQVSYGVTKSRDTVTVGEPFVVRVRVRAPAGATIRFPDNPDTAGTVQARDPRVIVTSDSVQSLDQMASYHVAAWDVGQQRVRFSDVVVTWNNRGGSGQQRVPLLNVSVFVRSVLPADSALRVPKPARPLWDQKAFPWWIVALVAAAIAIAIWWWRRRGKKAPAPVAPAIDPYDRAKVDFERIEAMGLVDAGERTRFVSLVIEVLRDYLAARYPDARLALTSKELVSVLRRSQTVSAEALSRVLHDADLAKFAGMALAEDRARAVGRDARAIVDREHSVAVQRASGKVAA
jgi:hypothetical protein